MMIDMQVQYYFNRLRWQHSHIASDQSTRRIDVHKDEADLISSSLLVRRANHRCISVEYLLYYSEVLMPSKQNTMSVCTLKGYAN
jgi:hypothetical protein